MGKKLQSFQKLRKGLSAAFWPGISRSFGENNNSYKVHLQPCIYFLLWDGALPVEGSVPLVQKSSWVLHWAQPGALPTQRLFLSSSISQWSSGCSTLTGSRTVPSRCRLPFTWSIRFIFPLSLSTHLPVVPLKNLAQSLLFIQGTCSCWACGTHVSPLLQ